MESPVFGYRQFEVGRGNLLYGMFTVPWKTLEMEAQCFCGSYRRPGPAPVDKPQHECGIYMLREPERPIPGYFIIAQCVGWGKVIEHERGWRVQHCRIERLILPPRPNDTIFFAISDLERHYGIPISPYEALTVQSGS